MLAMWLRNRRRRARALALGLLGLGLLTGRAAGAVTISLVQVSPAPPLVPGDTLTVDVTVSGLAANPNPTSHVAYDEAQLDFVSATFHPFLGVDLVNASSLPCTLANLDSVCDVLLDQTSSSGLVELGETSLWDTSVVDANQPASGVLATLVFEVQAPASSALSLTQLALWGSLVGGGEGALPATGVGLEVITVVPEPGTGALVLFGLLGLARRRRAS
jgi:hypothetical protein